jgi:cellulose synthase/poly-beta-1,6-N-acetylglucosamine synthase-like glycosyltransferase
MGFGLAIAFACLSRLFIHLAMKLLLLLSSPTLYVVHFQITNLAPLGNTVKHNAKKLQIAFRLVQICITVVSLLCLCSS